MRYPEGRYPYEYVAEDSHKIALELANAIDSTFSQVLEAWADKHGLAPIETAGISARALLIEASRAWKAFARCDTGADLDVNDIFDRLLKALPQD